MTGTLRYGVPLSAVKSPSPLILYSGHILYCTIERNMEEEIYFLLMPNPTNHNFSVNFE